MENGFETAHFHFEYTESDIATSVLWERHCHARFEMIGVLEGDISIMLEGKNYRLTKHQTAIIPPLCYHTITANKNGRYHRLTALFDASAIPEALRTHFLDRSEISIFFATHIEDIKNICCEADVGFYAPLAESLMVQCFYEKIAAAQNSMVTETDEFLQQAIAYIDAHLHEKILLEDIARCTSRSKSSFSHLFEEKMNISPKQYILHKKLALANKMIRDGTPPTDAAMRLGYENYSNFYRMYYKQYGVSPKQDCGDTDAN